MAWENGVNRGTTYCSVSVVLCCGWFYARSVFFCFTVDLGPWWNSSEIQAALAKVFLHFFGCAIPSYRFLYVFFYGRQNITGLGLVLVRPPLLVATTSVFSKTETAAAGIVGQVICFQRGTMARTGGWMVLNASACADKFRSFFLFQNIQKWVSWFEDLFARNVEEGYSNPWWHTYWILLHQCFGCLSLSCGCLLCWLEVSRCCWSVFTLTQSLMHVVCPQ